jgi:hypothetical protein
MAMFEPISGGEAAQTGRAVFHVIVSCLLLVQEPLSQGGLSRRFFEDELVGFPKNQLVGFERHARYDEPEDILAVGTFVTAHVVPVSAGLDADQRSFEVAGHAVRRGEHVCRVFP